MIHSPVSLAAVLSLFCFVNVGSAQGQVPPPVKITPIVPTSTGGAPPAATTPAPTKPISPPVLPPVTPVTPVAKPATPVAKPVEQAKYVVKAGDNPWKIAKNHGISVGDLVTANKIKDSKKLGIGDVLLLPPGVASIDAPAGTAAPSPAPTQVVAAAPAPSAPGDNWELYTVKSGDNPWNIAKRLKIDHQKILSLNEGLDFTKLKIGQQIKVPKKQG